MMIKYYVCADTYTTGDVNGQESRVFAGRVKTIVDAEVGQYAEAVAKGKDVIRKGLHETYGACNFGCMPVDDAEKMGDAEVYAKMRTIE